MANKLCFHHQPVSYRLIVSMLNAVIHQLLPQAALEQIMRDAAFLQRHNIMDYSLLMVPANTHVDIPLWDTTTSRPCIAPLRASLGPCRVCTTSDKMSCIGRRRRRH